MNATLSSRAIDAIGAGLPDRRATQKGMIDVNEANEVRGEVSIALGGEDFVLRPSYEAITAMERQSGMSLVELANAAGKGSMSHATAAIVVTECVKAWGKANKDELASGVNSGKIGKLIMEAGILLTLKKLELLLFVAATGGYTASGEARAAGTDTTETLAAA